MMTSGSTRADRPARALKGRTLVLGVLLGLLGLCACAAVFASVLVFSDWGRAKVAREVERRINAGIYGQLRIERIERIELPFVEARGVELVAPNGVAAIDVDHVRIELDFAALRDGRFAWHRADIHGGIVRVTEDEQGRVNMEETFRARPSSDEPQQPSDEQEQSSKQQSDAEGPLDLRTMVTSDMTLVIRGGSLPKLRMENLYGIMRVEALADGRVTLRFDEYRGNFVEGLPTGRLDFREVLGHVTTGQRRLLYFEGRGRSEGEPVAFELDIFRKPKALVKIDARFPRLSAESLATLGFAGYTRFTKNLELNVQPGELGGEPEREPVRGASTPRAGKSE